MGKDYKTRNANNLSAFESAELHPLVKIVNIERKGPTLVINKSMKTAHKVHKAKFMSSNKDPVEVQIEKANTKALYVAHRFGQLQRALDNRTNFVDFFFNNGIPRIQIRIVGKTKNGSRKFKVVARRYDGKYLGSGFSSAFVHDKKLEQSFKQVFNTFLYAWNVPHSAHVDFFETIIYNHLLERYRSFFIETNNEAV